MVIWFRWFSFFKLFDFQVPSLSFRGWCTTVDDFGNLAWKPLWDVFETLVNDSWMNYLLSGFRISFKHLEGDFWEIWAEKNYQPAKTNNDVNLGGGFKYFLFSPLLGEMIQFDQYFSNWLKLPTRSVCSGFFLAFWLWMFFLMCFRKVQWESSGEMDIMMLVSNLHIFDFKPPGRHCHPAGWGSTPIPTLLNVLPECCFKKISYALGRSTWNLQKSPHLERNMIRTKPPWGRVPCHFSGV